MISEKEFLQFVAGVFEVPAETLSLETEMNEFKVWDSVMHLRLIMEIVSAFHLDIPLEEIPELTSLGALYRKARG